MGNCQAVDAAALVIQHPCGKIERLYWPVTASEIMKMNPGHYVSLIIPLPVPEEQNQEQKTVRFTRVKLLRPNETLNLGHAYRLITTQEVVKVLRAKKHAKTKRPQTELVEKSHTVPEKQSLAGEEDRVNQDTRKTYQEIRAEKHRQRAAPANSATVRSKNWRPSLHSISESPS
ncbi:hypothetical protein L6164_027209 [Bauhinia variegata]|uniref:Uncharacterized protein n=1 Tax=Bauhinia variegata TaxID=167791 RepID=A0ACB9LTX7_BAUVA|nr:hypothetical protein L6164_027209 [Bauhinia variegata]